MSAPLAVVEPEADLAAQLREHAKRIHDHGRRTIEACLAIGKELLAARELLRAKYVEEPGTTSGRWRRFLDEDARMSRTQALRFMQVAERYGGESHAGPPSGASFRVLAELAGAEAGPEVVAGLEERLFAGERLSVHQVVSEIHMQSRRPSAFKVLPKFLDASPAPRCDANEVEVASWIWWRLREAERRGHLAFDPNLIWERLGAMQREDAQRILPAFLKFIEGLAEAAKPFKTAYVHFATAEDVEDFAQKIGRPVDMNTKRISWP